MNDWTATPAPAATTTASAASIDASLLRRARRRVALKTGFFIHALVFTLVNLGLFTLNQAIGGRPWSHFPLGGWGIALAIHGIVTIVKLTGDGWRDRLLATEVARLRSQA
ncbi:2TM domain-containing protein [Ideonella sp.]|uniref:2TM domain-containing protein n=1 Tax=Ideonella sp. TaxID=1929293 RepID=UPI0035AFD612